MDLFSKAQLVIAKVFKYTTTKYTYANKIFSQINENAEIRSNNQVYKKLR